MTTTFKKLKDAYQLALNQKADSFTLDGNEFVTGYAKYLIEYLAASGCKPHNKIEFTPRGE